jgi:hypothetical protein
MNEMDEKCIQFPITLEELDKYAYDKLYDNARNIFDRTRTHTLNGQREKYKNVKCLFGDSIPNIRDGIWNNERLKNEMRKFLKKKNWIELQFKKVVWNDENIVKTEEQSKNYNKI